MAILMEQLETGMKQISVVEGSVVHALDHGARLRVLPYLKEDGGACLPGTTGSQSQSKPTATDEDLDDGVSFGKLQKAPRVRALRMNLASCYVPDHDEDAHFVHPKSGFVGVADGVGGCRGKGVDAGAFARALMKHALAGANTTANPVDPYSLLQEAYLKAAGSSTPGASTAVIVSLSGTTLRWACLGDSGFAVFRGGKMRHGRPTASRTRVVGEMQVAVDDVVVVGTDGLFDNVFDMDLERMVRRGCLSPQMMAEKIAATARKASKSLAPSPFSLESAKNVKDGRERHFGGKVDDITVIVAYIVPKGC
ncbi:hypothetical protein PR202_ga02075 [Eleusine coracana subsp. coracana]|uniref:Protein phosphatase n=1 Tax=Eleusine coracana subsp. coracana TaxID=191504 RepID=A0AAV5BI29_ELECO|nr:hypothetical protein PR202_ga01388 [Eleusine coracana subsp. coracana]GJM86234.1 hypothetical protein PR202_ga02075 [Eleusine coracana subsp. coracana]